MPPYVGERQEAADVDERILLAAEGAAVRQAEHLLGDLAQRAVLVPLLPLADEPRVLREAAGVEEERDPVLVTRLAHGAQVGHRNRLAAAAVVRHRDDDDRDVLRAGLLDLAVERLDVEVALERRGREEIG
jgi:hypothetical protein